MAITRTVAEKLAEWVFEYGIGGRCLQLARQDINLGKNDLGVILRRVASRDAGNTYVERARSAVARLPAAAEESLSDQAFFSTLGFSEIRSVDVDASGDFVFDLNKPGLLSAVGGPYDFLMETGTAEHVFHLPNYLANVCETVGVDGFVLHSVPVNGWVDHGFYQFSPTLFHDFYLANGFRLLRFQLLQSAASNADDADLRDYEPGSLDSLNAPSFPGKFVSMLVLAQKTPESTSDRIPIQGVYAAGGLWEVTRAMINAARLRRVAVLQGPFGAGGERCWIVQLPGHAGVGDSAAATRRSTLILLEDGKVIGPPHALHEDIRTRGGGRYSHWGDFLYFSTSDNSDPNLNSRRYEICSAA